jgi:nitric oxide reductase NorE protein
MNKDEAVAIDHRNFFYPPGGILLWLIIFVELITFGLGLLALVYYGRLEPEVFHRSRLQLNTGIGTFNTVVLLTSGFFMASAVQHFRSGGYAKANTFLKLTLAGGAVFIALKSYEYFEKLSAGVALDENMFFTLYWMLTVFHLAHVLVGMVILTWFSVKMKRAASIDLLDLESGAAFWHMCDLIWLLIFPALYLIF